VPSGERVEIQPIGRGTTQDLKGFRGDRGLFYLARRIHLDILTCL
jgi:hypothetical protein